MTEREIAPPPSSGRLQPGGANTEAPCAGHTGCLDLTYAMNDHYHLLQLYFSYQERSTCSLVHNACLDHFRVGIKWIRLWSLAEQSKKMWVSAAVRPTLHAMLSCLRSARLIRACTQVTSTKRERRDSVQASSIMAMLVCTLHPLARAVL